MPKILKRSAAQRDLVAHFMYLAENASVSVADRFLTCVDTSIQQLAQHPQMGRAVRSANRRLDGIRKWQVNDFDDYLIFYFSRDHGISIVRVLHAARNWWRMLKLVE